VSLPNLKRMHIFGGGPPSLLLDHLLIPAGAKLTTEVGLHGSLLLPKSLDFIKEFYRFRLHLYVRDFYPSIRFSGPECDISIIPVTPQTTSTTCRVLESLARFEPSSVERLRLAGAGLMERDGCDLDRVFPRMNNVRVLTVSRCTGLSRFFPYFNDWVRCYCPKLEEFILDPRGDEAKFDIQGVIGLAAKAELKSVRIVSWDKSVQTSALKLKEYVSHVECSPRVAMASDDIDSDDEEE